jgi:hypothetical protein
MPETIAPRPLSRLVLAVAGGDAIMIGGTVLLWAHYG